jgi:hypothetical protein
LTFTAALDTFQQGITQFESTLAVSGNHHFGDTRHRLVTYVPVGTSRFRDYFPFTDGQIASEQTPITAIGKAVTLSIPSSARPDSPKVHSVIPAFDWSYHKVQGETAASQRVGRTVRIYLERPWFSSGDGELLGVTLLPGTAAMSVARRVRLGMGATAAQLLRPKSRLRAQADTNSPIPLIYKPYITQWGMDPLWSSAPIPKEPDIADFPLKVSSVQNTPLEELPELLVNVAGHNVSYDANRQLWFADIRMAETESYYPFVRLALARYQPQSVTGVYISRVVLADFAQLAPDRHASVLLHPNGHVVAGVYGFTGLSNEATAQLNQPGTFMFVFLEKQNTDGSEDFGWSLVKIPGGASNGAYPLAFSIPSSTYPNDALWEGAFTIPSYSSSNVYRVTILEYEGWNTDATVSGGQAVAPRLVYATTLNL